MKIASLTTVAIALSLMSSAAMAQCNPGSPCERKCKFEPKCMAYWSKINAKGIGYARKHEAAGYRFRDGKVVRVQ